MVVAERRGAGGWQAQAGHLTYALLLDVSVLAAGAVLLSTQLLLPAQVHHKARAGE